MSLVVKTNRKLLFLIQKIRIWLLGLKISDAIVIGKAIRKQPLLISGEGKITFSDNVKVGYFPSPFFFSGYTHFDVRDNGEIYVGKDVVINNNATLIADGVNIYISDRCLIGPNFKIFTSDFHALNPKERLSAIYEKMEVFIGENVFIGADVTILKGVTIGDNSVIGNGSIVSKSIPANVIAVGNPCRVLKELA